MEQTREPRKNPYKYNQLILDRQTKTIEKEALSTIGAGRTGVSTCRKMNLYRPYTF